MGKKKKGGLLWLENFSYLAKLSVSSLPSEAQYSSFCKKYPFQALPSSVSTRMVLDELSMGCQLQELMLVHLLKCSFTRRGGG